jgi:glc operon protein GlcG
MRKYIFEVITLIAALLCVAASANAQIAEKQSLNLQGAKQIIAAAQAEAKRVNAPGGVVAVVDDGGNLIAVERLDGTFNAGASISIGKARTAALFKKPTKFFEDVIKNGRTSMVALNDFTPLQGGVPVIVNNQIVGAVGVSGAASAQQDEELAIAGANVFVAKPVTAAPSAPPAATPPAANAGVKYFQACDVDASFDKGAVLFDGAGSNYMIHTSRRKEPGVAEVHAKDADLIYVVDGKAKFITGGSVVDGKNIAADEIRGSAINGGDTRMLAKGDVIVVPAGTPHQFKEVTAPFLYYVVKVR